MAKVEISKRWIADDGKAFDTREACEQYELSDALKPLTKMTLENLQSIMAGQDETRETLMRRVLSAINKPVGEPKVKRPRRSAEERAADLEAKLAKLRGNANGAAHETDSFIS